MFWRQVRPRLIWDVTTAVQVTNERVAGITGANPLKVPEGSTGAIFHTSIASSNRTLTAMRIYGGLRNTGFPPVATITEGVIVHATFAGTGAAGEGKLSVPSANTVNASRPRHGNVFVFPPWILLEYSTAATGTNDLTCHFSVFVTWLGPPYFGVS
jgi:hypothetical protein